MLRWQLGVCVLAALALTGPSAASAEPPSQADAELFRKNCQTCHSLEAGGPRRAGPDLQQVFGRAVGTVAGFPYSQALRDADFRWNAEAMDHWLTNPQAFLPGTYMMYRQADPQVRGAIIRYLQAVAGPAEPQ